jgi:diguanylate cyclase (GGDEF)-like protein/PAS domain S-box-containing protein
MKAPLPPNEAQRLETLRGYDVLDTPPESAFDDLALLAAQICHVPIALISLVDENRQWFKSTIGVSATETSRDFAFCAHAILYSDEMLEVRDAQFDPRFADNPLVTADPHIRFYAGAPLVAPDGLALGTLCVIDRVPRVLSAEQQTALRALSRTVIAQLELRRTLAACHRAEEQLQSLNASLEQKVEARTTELQREMEVQRESEQQYRTLADSGQVLIWTSGTDKLCDYFNKSWLEFTGHTLEQELDNGWVDSVHPDDFQRYVDVYVSSFDRREKFSMDYRLRRYDGEYRWIQDDGCPRYNSEGEFIGYIGYCLGITERKQAEMSLRERESQLHAIIENLTEGLAVSDLNGQLRHFNRAALDLHGFTTLNECRQHLTKFADTFELSSMDGTVLSLDQWPLARILRGESLRDLEVRVRHIQAGWQRIFSYGGTLALDADDQPMVAIVTISNITERKQIEIDLRISSTAFELHESLMITDANRVILRVNQTFTKDTGYTAEEVVGKTPRLLRSGRHKADFYHAMWETIHQTGTWQGEIWDRRKNGEIYPKWLTITAVKGADGIVTNYVGSHIDITERKAAEEKIQYLGFYDALTRLPNRRLLMDRFQQALASSARSGSEGALLLIDLDNFKTLNDTLGHQIGDLLLQQAAQRLESCVREGDTVARLGGDEFVVMLENLSEHALEAAAQTESIGEKILAILSQPYQLDIYEHQCTSSIGATLFNDHQQATDELLKQADIAMYQAKKAGRNTLRFFDPQMQASITARVSLEGELRKALEKQQFHLYYQIQVDSSSRSLGAEVLIRWIHPERGMVSPAQFIPLAEETGLILPIGRWVLETACTQIKAWEQDALTRDLVLAVNVSAKQFHQADFVAQVQAVVHSHAINPMLLKLELTEGMLLENIEDTIATMNALKEIGIKFSLDDFGTGYSSLQYLKRLPLDQLKIDQSFVRDIATDISDMAIVRTIIAMAQSLDMDVIAEGVETEENRQFLLNNGCTHYQGYLFGKPVPIAQFEALLKQD